MKTTTRVLTITGAALALLAIGRFSSSWGGATDAEAQQHVRTLSTVRILASASGVVGALIGMVNMLANMDDPRAIGPAMAVALLTVLYGVIIAELFVGPLINRLRNRAKPNDQNENPMRVTVVTLAAVPLPILAFFVMLLSMHQ